MNYRIGDLSFDKATGNLDEALVWYRRAAEQGDVDSEIVLALAYAKGIGVQQSDVVARANRPVARDHRLGVELVEARQNSPPGLHLAVSDPGVGVDHDEVRSERSRSRAMPSAW